MPKPKHEPDDKEQSRRFIEKAKELADKYPDKKFDRALKSAISEKPGNLKDPPT